MPINVNPDRVPEALPAEIAGELAPESAQRSSIPTGEPQTPIVPTPRYALLAPLHLGSNNWVVGPTRSANGAAIVVNDPHLDARLLPGPMYPIGLSTPDFHAAGVALPALPGFLVGRTDRVAYGVTNAYGDVQDLFVERIDPSSSTHYLEGDTREPFDIREEVIRIKDDSAEGGFRERRITVRSTHRGPVISDHGTVNLGDRVVSLKWSAADAFGPEIGYDKLLFARSAAEVDRSLQLIDINMFNFVFADVDGNFGRRATGKIPVRRQGAGLLPVAVTDAEPHWTSWIPKDQMPGEFNPERGWTGTANHDTRPTGYPFTYSTYFSPSYRYRRLTQLLDGNNSVSATDHWQYIHDNDNLQAARMAPVLVPLLRASGFTKIADTLAEWSHVDDAEDRAPLTYQVLYQELARATFEDDLGEALTKEMLGTWYFWQERFDRMVANGDSHWFDDARTPEEVEGLPDVVATAAAAARTRLAALGPETVWGDIHRLRFTSPIRSSGLGSEWLGGGDYPMSGSGETLHRARYGFNKPFDTAFFASFKFVSDMARGDTIMTALPGGVAARVLHDHYKDQIPSWHAEKATDTPLTREAAQTAAVSTLMLVPRE